MRRHTGPFYDEAYQRYAPSCGEFLYFLKWRASRAAGRAAACGSPEPPGLAPSRLGDRGTAGHYGG